MKKTRIKGLLGMFLTLIRNQVWLKPRALLAKHGVKAYLEKMDFKPKAYDIWLGLAQPEQLSLAIIFSTDHELKTFLRMPKKKKAQEIFHHLLARYRYPKRSIKFTKLNYHSQQAITRAGGWYTYFK